MNMALSYLSQIAKNPYVVGVREHEFEREAFLYSSLLYVRGMFEI